MYEFDKDKCKAQLKWSRTIDAESNLKMRTKLQHPTLTCMKIGNLILSKSTFLRRNLRVRSCERMAWVKSKYKC